MARMGRRVIPGILEIRGQFSLPVQEEGKSLTSLLFSYQMQVAAHVQVGFMPGIFQLDADNLWIQGTVYYLMGCKG